MKLLSYFLSAVLIISLAACGKKEEPKPVASFDTVESARKQAKENAEFNAKAWRAQAPAYTKLSLIGRGDSTQTPECPQGDGWATMDLVDPETPTKKITLKCSTVSDSIGCREQNDFKGSPFGSEDGRCQPTTKVPFPLPKIEK